MPGFLRRMASPARPHRREGFTFPSLALTLILSDVGSRGTAAGRSICAPTRRGAPRPRRGCKIAYCAAALSSPPPGTVRGSRRPRGALARSRAPRRYPDPTPVEERIPSPRAQPLGSDGVESGAGVTRRGGEGAGARQHRPTAQASGIPRAMPGRALVRGRNWTPGASARPIPGRKPPMCRSNQYGVTPSCSWFD